VDVAVVIAMTVFVEVVVAVAFVVAV